MYDLLCVPRLIEITSQMGYCYMLQLPPNLSTMISLGYSVLSRVNSKCVVSLVPYSWKVLRGSIFADRKLHPPNFII